MIEMTKTQRGMDAIAAAVDSMLHNRLQNYIVPGLTSHLVGGGEHGKVRLFFAERNTRDIITPHSHRFDFTCLVLSGFVRNTIYHEGINGEEDWCISTIDQVCGANGLREFVHTREDSPTRFKRETSEYKPGDTYSMKYEEIHSIEFTKGTTVLFFEGPQVVSRSKMIEPWVDGKVVPTFKTEPWMFEREHDSATEPHT
jgi:hypothetical protein